VQQLVAESVDYVFVSSEEERDQLRSLITKAVGVVSSKVRAQEDMS
jgi:hypothetical protein